MGFGFCEIAAVLHSVTCVLLPADIKDWFQSFSQDALPSSLKTSTLVRRSLYIGAPCNTPNNEKAVCTSLQECPLLLKKENIELRRQSHCGFIANESLVCCGPTNITSTPPISKTAGRSAPCTTPNNESAICIPLLDCPIMINAITTKRSDYVEFAKRSQCGYDTQPLVCCGTAVTLESNLEPLFGRSLFPDIAMCGLDFTTRIFGGSTAHVTEFSWLALLEYKKGQSKELKCSGSLIHSKYVLTAAHCTAIPDSALLAVRLGEWQLSTEPDCLDFECADPTLRVSISQVITHPLYNPVTNRNDIALLRLQKPIAFSDYIQPICLPSAKFPPLNTSTHLSISGWGLTSDESISDTKMKSDVMVLSDDACIGSNKSIQSLMPNQKCVGWKTKGSCWADFGGPVMLADFTEAELRWFQDGVISWMEDCDRIVYTRILPYVSWISENVV